MFRTLLTLIVGLLAFAISRAAAADVQQLELEKLDTKLQKLDALIKEASVEPARGRTLRRGVVHESKGRRAHYVADPDSPPNFSGGAAGND